MAKFDETKLRDCVKAYGIDPASVKFTGSEVGKNGMFIGYEVGDSAKRMEIGVVNDVSYSRREIGNMGLGDPDNGVTLSRYGGRPDGAMKPNGKPEIIDAYTPYRNYTANNLSNPIGILTVQIHELGHSLSMITGVRPYTDSYSRLRANHESDAGSYLERCVFGGEVDRNGRLYR